MNRLHLSFAALFLHILTSCSPSPEPQEDERSAKLLALDTLPALEVDIKKAALGKELFFDPRLSGDGAISCATCHNPKKGWGDGQALSRAYPGSEYFRNSKTLLNAAHARYFFWDGRLSGKDGETLVRDHITETHFMNLDGRLMMERLKQVPEYERMFRETMGGEPSFGRTLKAVAEFQKTIVSKNVPFDRYVQGDSAAISTDAKVGLRLFQGKARCVQCHNGPYFSDANPHNLGLPENPAIVNESMRHITLRSFFKFMGVDNFENLREDAGFYAVSKREEDRKAFLTPTLRELKWTAPYMHNGTLADLDAVIAFYDAGGGKAENKDPLLRPLRLSKKEKRSLKAFLLALSGDEVKAEAPEPKPYRVIENWTEVAN